MKRKPEGAGGAPDPDAAEIRARALGLLTRREHSVAELQRKLQQRGYPAALVAPVLAELAAANLLSESRYAEELVHARVARGQGPLKIQAELRQQGLAEAAISRALALAGADWPTLARQARQRRFGPAAPRDYGERARQARFLQSRGFSAEQARAALGGDPDD